jgi:steroid delta-isomerase-like uncharacterized protein
LDAPSRGLHERGMQPHEPENVRLIRRYFAELWNEGRVELIPELLAENYVNHSPGTPDMPRDRSGVAGIVRAMRTAFPDLNYRIDGIVADDRAVAVRLSVSGTHAGDFFGVPPSGKSFRVAQINIEQVQDGKIVAHYRTTDELSLLRQIGALPG